MDKLYTLPDLTPAPYSEVQGLVRRLIEYADWSVLPALVDELREQGRTHELHWFGRTIVNRPHGSIWQYDQNNWGQWATELMSLFYFDLFDVNAVAAHFGAVKWVSSEEAMRRALELHGAVTTAQTNNRSRMVILPQNRTGETVRYAPDEDKYRE